MQLDKKRMLVARTLAVGKERIVFNKERLGEIKEAITKQDIRDLVQAGAISVSEVKGRRAKPERKTRRKMGSIKKRVNTRKRDYITITRKLRRYIAELRKQETLADEEYWKLRKEIKSKAFRSKAHLKERLVQLMKEREE